MRRGAVPGVRALAVGAGASTTLTSLLIVFGAAALLALPAIGLLFTLAQRSLIEEGERPRMQP